MEGDIQFQNYHEENGIFSFENNETMDDNTIIQLRLML
jgi:hypothetical protein